MADCQKERISDGNERVNQILFFRFFFFLLERGEDIFALHFVYLSLYSPILVRYYLFIY